MAAKDTIPQDTTRSKVVKRTKPKLNLTDMVMIKNGYAGKLVVYLPKEKYAVTLNHFGDEDYVELAELKALRNSFPKYFTENWVVIEDPDVVSFLSLDKICKTSITIDEMAEFFTLPTDDMKQKIGEMSEGQKKSLIYLALEKIENGELDSRNTITFLENELHTQLVEK